MQGQDELAEQFPAARKLVASVLDARLSSGMGTTMPLSPAKQRPKPSAVASPEYLPFDKLDRAMLALSGLSPGRGKGLRRF